MRQYIGKPDSPSRHLLYLVGVSALMVPSSEQDRYISDWIAEIAQAKGWARIIFTIDLLRFGPSIYCEKLFTQFADRLKLQKRHQ
jgi:hypothetical protein